MLAQVPSGTQITPALLWIAATIAVFVPGGMALKWAVDQARTWLPDTWPSWFWPLLAVVLALLICLLFQVNVIAPQLQGVPAVAHSSALRGVWGQIVTAFGLAGMASYYHDRSK